MNDASAPTIIPLVNINGGELLPHRTWEAYGVTWLAYALEPLLFKPGIAYLETLPSLATYVGWPHKIVLEASSLTGNASGLIQRRSPFDGSLLSLTQDQLHALITALKPDAICWPGAPMDARITATPLQLAREGNFYLEGRLTSLTAAHLQQDYQRLDAACGCDTCRLGLTRAYLHYLWQAVPLLCQRFLAQHHGWGMIPVTPHHVIPRYARDDGGR